MGLRYQTQANGLLYTVVDDIQKVYRAVITGSLVDEATGIPAQAEAVIEADLPGLSVHFAEGGLFAVTGYVEQVFPNLGTAPYSVQLSVAAPGYRPVTFTVPLPAGSTLPIAWPAIKLRPLPLRLQGRVVKESDRSALAGATVSSGNSAVLMVRSPLYFDHAAGVTINAFTFPAVGPQRGLAVSANGGSGSVLLDSVAGLLTGQLLQIGAGPLAELAVIQGFGPGAAQVNLQSPLNSTFAALSPVQPVTATGPGASTTLARSSNQGDGLVILSAALVATGVQVSDGTATEYHLLNPVTDPLGYYHLNGVSGVVSLSVQAAASGFSTAAKTWFLSYNVPVNVIDFRLKP